MRATSLVYLYQRYNGPTVAVRSLFYSELAGSRAFPDSFSLIRMREPLLSKNLKSGTAIYRVPTFAITSRIRDYATVVPFGINFVGTRELNVSSRITVRICGV